ncbi:MAG: cupin domain-containing protein [Planctomycetales bacterium]|nr:cupin domain-containing protein [Planctomycetales bacterium]
MSKPQIIDFDQVAPVGCPCGQARRALADVADFPATIHLTEISVDAQTHYHREHAETYYIIDCDADARMELDGELHPLKPGMLVHIPIGVRHRAVGAMKILNIVFPKFDPADEHFDP